MNNPIETNSFTHYLRFVSLGRTDLYRITEPIGFDVAEFQLVQDEKGFSRSTTYMAKDDKVFTFADANVEKISYTQVQDPNGRESEYLDFGLKWILDIRKRYGFESNIEYILKKDGLEFVVGILGMEKAETDGATYFSCNIIQDNVISAYQKHADTKINVFSDKNIKGETITPVTTIDFLRKAVPSLNGSNWVSVRGDGTFEMITYTLSIAGTSEQEHAWNYCQQIIKSEINNTLTFIQGNEYNDYAGFDRNNLKYLRAKQELRNIKIKIGGLTWNQQVDGLGGGNGYAINQFAIRWGYSYETPLGELLLINNQIFNGDTVYNEIDDTFTVPYMPIGSNLYIVFYSFCRQSDSLGGELRCTHTISNYTIDIEAVEGAIDTIVKGVRYIDMIKQTSKAINNLPITAPKFDVGGDFYDQICYNRALVNGDTTIPFTTTFKEIAGSVEEVCGDYEVNANDIFVGQFDDYYNNNEIAVFNVIPSKDFKENWNERFTINSIKFGYKTYEQDRDSENTKEDVHTESEWIIPNEKVQNKKAVINYLVRSGYSQQAVVDLEIQKKSTSDITDDDVFCVSVIPLPPNSFNEIGAVLLLRIVDGNLQILNKTSTADSSDVVINWTLLGLSVGQSIEITDGANIGNYTVAVIEATTLTLTPVGFTPIEQDDKYINIKYYFVNILYQTETNENMTVTGVVNTDNYPNLKYTIRRNLVYWESYMNTACSFQRDKQITNSYFKNNVPLVTQYTGGIAYAELDPISVDSLQDRILTPKTIEIECISEFSDILNLLDTLKVNRGFVRCYDLNGKIIKGYIKELGHTWKTNKLRLLLEEKYEDELLILDYEDYILTVNDVAYNLNGISNWWDINTNYLIVFDANQRPICNQYHYSKVELNGIIYPSIDELKAQLVALSL